MLHKLGVGILSFGQSDQLLQILIEATRAENSQKLSALRASHLVPYLGRNVERGARGREDGFVVESKLDGPFENVEDLNHFLMMMTGQQEARLEEVLDQG